MTNRQIFLDMDGVIVDLPCPIPATPEEQLAFYRGGLAKEPEKVWAGTDELWWANLPWTKEGVEIVRLCEEAVGAENVIICTMPADWPGSAQGKLLWIEKHMPQYRRRFILTPQKHWAAHARTLLIDDREENIQQFRAAGGAGILCPRPWNAGNEIADRVIW